MSALAEDVVSGKGITRSDRNRAIRQAALREQLSRQKHVEHVVEIAEKLQDIENELDALEVQRLRAAAEIRLKLVAKYIPDLKTVEFEAGQGMPEGGMEITIRTVKAPEPAIEGQYEETKDDG